MVALLLLHKVGLVTEAIATVGVAFTFIVVFTEFPDAQLAMLVPVNVYWVVVPGVTTKLDPLKAPGFNV